MSEKQHGRTNRTAIAIMVIVATFVLLGFSLFTGYDGLFAGGVTFGEVCV